MRKTYGALVLRVAVAANFLTVARDLAGDFERESGIRVELAPGSSGKLYAQITQGAERAGLELKSGVALLIGRRLVMEGAERSTSTARPSGGESVSARGARSGGSRRRARRCSPTGTGRP